MCFKDSDYIISLKFYNPTRQYCYYPHFTDEETEAQRR